MSKSLKMRFLSLVLALVTIFSVMPAMSASAATTSNYFGALGIAPVQTTVYRDQSCSTYQGYLYANETFTILDQYSNGVWFIRYSMSSGAKTGYIHAVNIPTYWKNMYETTTCVAIPTGHVNVYYGNSSTGYVRAGYVDEEEYVVFLSEDGNWAYIEYDTTSGRKRGYVPVSSLTLLNGGPLHNGDFYPFFTGTNQYISGSYNVYAGPNMVYTTIGSVSDMNVSIVLNTSNLNTYSSYTTYYIEYTVTGTSQKKGGFIFMPNN